MGDYGPLPYNIVIFECVYRLANRTILDRVECVRELANREVPGYLE